MSVLSEEFKTAIVQRLACFMKPIHIARPIKEDFDITISRQHAIKDFAVAQKRAKMSSSPRYKLGLGA